MSYVGINIGALTVKVVTVRLDPKNAEDKTARVIVHQGRPLDVLDRLLAAPEFADA